MIDGDTQGKSDDRRPPGKGRLQHVAVERVMQSRLGQELPEAVTPGRGVQIAHHDHRQGLLPAPGGYPRQLAISPRRQSSGQRLLTVDAEEQDLLTLNLERARAI